MSFIGDVLDTDVSGSAFLRVSGGAATRGTTYVLSGSGPVDVYTPSPGRAIRLLWLGIATSEDNPETTVVTVYLSGVAVYQWPLGTPGVFVHTAARSGPKDGKLSVSQTSTGSLVYFNADIQEF